MLQNITEWTRVNMFKPGDKVRVLRDITRLEYLDDTYTKWEFKLYVAKGDVGEFISTFRNRYKSGSSALNAKINFDGKIKTLRLTSIEKITRFET